MLVAPPTRRTWPTPSRGRVSRPKRTDPIPDRVANGTSFSFLQTSSTPAATVTVRGGRFSSTDLARVEPPDLGGGQWPDLQPRQALVVEPHHVPRLDRAGRELVQGDAILVDGAEQVEHLVDD